MQPATNLNMTNQQYHALLLEIFDYIGRAHSCILEKDAANVKTRDHFATECCGGTNDVGARQWNWMNQTAWEPKGVRELEKMMAPLDLMMYQTIEEDGKGWGKNPQVLKWQLNRLMGVKKARTQAARAKSRSWEMERDAQKVGTGGGVEPPSKKARYV